MYEKAEWSKKLGKVVQSILDLRYLRIVQMSRDSPELLWEEEAQGVISDVCQHVKEIAISSSLQSTNSHIYLNITTLEDQPYTVELSASGFRVIAKRYDSIVESETGRFYDTPYALLTVISPMFPANFAQALKSKLEKLGENQND